MPDTDLHSAYRRAVIDAQDALLAAMNAIHDMPAPDSDYLNWADVGEMNRFAKNIREAIER
jgi:hypothetical protein